MCEAVSHIKHRTASNTFTSLPTQPRFTHTPSGKCWGRKGQGGLACSFEKAVHRMSFAKGLPQLPLLMRLTLHTTTWMEVVVIFFVGLPVLAMAPCLLLRV